MFSSNKESVDPTVAAAMERSDTAATRLMEGFATTTTTTAHHRHAAAAKLISNHEAIVKDCTNTAPKTQTDLERAVDESGADAALRAVASALLREEGAAHVVPSWDDRGDAADTSQALRTVARRLCVPRDMGAPSAAILRKTLVEVADRIGSSS